MTPLTTPVLRSISQGLIALLLFCAANVVTYESSGFFQRDSGYAQQVEDIATHPDVHIIFAGDSHFAVPLNDYLNVNPATPAYSIATGGDSLREAYAKVRRVLETTPKIDTLILSADPHMFGRDRLQSSNRSFANRYFILARDRSGLPQGMWSAILQQVPLFNEDFLQYFRKYLHTLSSGSSPQVRGGGDGLAWSRLTDAERMERGVQTGREDHAGVGDVQPPFIWYQRILEVARAHHVRVIGVRFPVTAGYSSQAPADKVAAIDAFMLSHGVAQIVDLRNALQDPRDFDDEDHLNDIGAVLAVKLLEQRIQLRIQ
jgi:hypothetical protein